MLRSSEYDDKEKLVALCEKYLNHKKRFFDNSLQSRIVEINKDYGLLLGSPFFTHLFTQLGPASNSNENEVIHEQNEELNHDNQKITEIRRRAINAFVESVNMYNLSLQNKKVLTFDVAETLTQKHYANCFEIMKLTICLVDKGYMHNLCNEFRWKGYEDSHNFETYINQMLEEGKKLAVYDELYSKAYRYHCLSSMISGFFSRSIISKYKPEYILLAKVINMNRALSILSSRVFASNIEDKSTFFIHPKDNDCIEKYIQVCLSHELRHDISQEKLLGYSMYSHFLLELDDLLYTLDRKENMQNKTFKLSEKSQNLLRYLNIHFEHNLKINDLVYNVIKETMDFAANGHCLEDESKIFLRKNLYLSLRSDFDKKY